MTTMVPKTQVDRGWAWVVLAVNCVFLTIGGGFTFSVGMFNLVFLEHFEESAATTAWVGSLAMGLQYFTGPLSSMFISRFGWRAASMLGGAIAGVGLFLSSWSTNIVHLYLAFGVMVGCGLGLMYISSIVVIGHYFKRYMVLAYGITSAWISIGILCFPPMINHLLALFSWRETLVIVGCICLQICVGGALLRPLPVDTKGIDCDRAISDTEQEGSGVAGNWDLSRCGVVKELMSAKFVLFCINLFAAGIGLSSVYLHLSAFTVTEGATTQEASVYLSVIGVAGLCGRALTGLAGNHQSVDTLLLYIGTMGITGLITILFPFIVSSYPARMLYAVSFGLYSGANSTMLAPVTIELVGVKLLNAAFGIEMVLSGLAFACGPPIAGWLFDTTESYDFSFYAAGICMMASAVVTMMVPVASFTRRRHSPGDKSGVKDIGFQADEHVTDPIDPMLDHAHTTSSV